MYVFMYVFVLLFPGDIEDFPGLDSLPKFKVEINDGRVRVSGSKALLESKKRRKPLTLRDPNDEQTFAIVGGGELIFIYLLTRFLSLDTITVDCWCFLSFTLL